MVKLSNTTSEISVLLVDDHAVVRAGIRQFLERSSLINVIAEVENGQQAQEIIQVNAPDLVIVDIQMPVMNGIEFTKWVNNHFPDINILILSAYDDDPYLLAAFKAGANGYILKTATPDDIIRAVVEIHHGRSMFSSEAIQVVMNALDKSDHDTQYEPLTERENEILVYVSRGLTNRAIGHELKISDRTVQGHLAHIFAKLQVSSRTEAVMRGLELGYIQPPSETS